MAQFYSFTIHFKMIKSQPFLKRVITTEIKIAENTSAMLDQDQTDCISCVSPSRAMCGNRGDPSTIQWPQLNHNDSYPCVSLEPLIKDQTLYPIVTPNLPYKLRCSSTL